MVLGHSSRHWGRSAYSHPIVYNLQGRHTQGDEEWDLQMHLKVIAAELPLFQWHMCSWWTKTRTSVFENPALRDFAERCISYMRGWV